jgi:hypothetical protein
VTSAVQPCPVPDDSLLAVHAGLTPGSYADAFFVDVPGSVPLSDLVAAFYSSRMIAPELFLIGALFNRPSSRNQALQLGRGEIEAFSAWRVHQRTDDQVLMRETLSDKTRSWMRVQPAAGGVGTRLYFGSAVLPVGRRADGAPRMSGLFHALLGFHRLYSRLLLASARTRLVGPR